MLRPVKFIDITMFFVLLCLASTAEAGTADVGGGTAVVCRNNQGQVESVELLDLVEGSRLNFLIPQSEESSDRQAELMISRLRFGYEGQVFQSASPASYLRHVQKIAMPLPDGYGLNAPNDLGKSQAVLVRNGCKLELIGQREKVGPRVQLSIVPSLFSAMSKTHQAAFWVHEAIYSFYQSYFRTRVSDDIGTAQIRRLTAALFARNTNIEQIVAASRFLFVLDKGKTYLADARAKAVVELHGRLDEFDTEFEPLRADDETKFYCVDSGAKTKSTSHFFQARAGAPTRLLLQNDSGCLSQLVIKGLKARLLVNGKEILEVTRDYTLDLDFLRDRANFSELLEQAKYPFSKDPLSKNRNVK